MSDDLDFFQRILFEAPEDAPPDMDMTDTDPPDMPADDDMVSGDPPDIDQGGDMNGGDDMGPPPDMDGKGFVDEGGEDDQSNDQEEGNAEGEDNNKKLGLDDKISAIMNMNLYQRFLSLLNTIGNQISMLKNNNDILLSILKEYTDIFMSLKKLDENIRLYLKNSFINENYSKNLLFFNKCVNLLKLLNDVFSQSIKDGMKSM